MLNNKIKEFFQMLEKKIKGKLGRKDKKIRGLVEIHYPRSMTYRKIREIKEGYNN